MTTEATDTGQQHRPQEAEKVSLLASAQQTAPQENQKLMQTRAYGSLDTDVKTRPAGSWRASLHRI